MKSISELSHLIQDWAEEKGILEHSSPIHQFQKLLEETGEVLESIITGDEENLKKEIGDVFVVVNILALLSGTDLTTCANKTWDKIKKRTGKMENGVFVKDAAP